MVYHELVSEVYVTLYFQLSNERSRLFQLHVKIRRRVLSASQPLSQRVEPAVSKCRHLSSAAWHRWGAPVLRLWLSPGLLGLAVWDQGAGCVRLCAVPKRGYVQTDVAVNVWVWLPTRLYRLVFVNKLFLTTLAKDSLQFCCADLFCLMQPTRFGVARISWL